MKKISIILFFITISFLPQLSYAQVNPIKEFSSDNIKFLEDVKVMLEVTNMDKKEIKEYLEQFALAWNNPKLNDALKSHIYETCNLMVK